VEYRLPHPSDPQRHAIYGFDPRLRQYWGEVYEAPAEWEIFNSLTGKAMKIVETGRRRDSYDALGCRYDAARPLLGLLTWLSEHGFFSADDLNETLELLREHGSDAVPKRLRGVAQVIHDLDDAAG